MRTEREIGERLDEINIWDMDEPVRMSDYYARYNRGLRDAFRWVLKEM